MNLPTSRNTTYAPNSPVLSADVNALQDCVIGAKFPSITKPLDAEGWRTEGGGQATLDVSLWVWTWGGFDAIGTGIREAVGTRITGARFRYNRTSGTFNFRIQKKAHGAGAWTGIVAQSDLATVGDGTMVLACAEIIAADTQYRLRVEHSAIGTFDVASYTIDRL